MDDIHKQTSSTSLICPKETTTVLDKQYRLSNRDTKNKNKNPSVWPVKFLLYRSIVHLVIFMALYRDATWTHSHPPLTLITHTHKQLVAYHDALRGTGPTAQPVFDRNTTQIGTHEQSQLQGRGGGLFTKIELCFFPHFWHRYLSGKRRWEVSVITMLQYCWNSMKCLLGKNNAWWHSTRRYVKTKVFYKEYKICWINGHSTAKTQICIIRC